MLIFLGELKKMWSWRILLIIVVTGVLTWFAFLLPEVRDYNDNYGNIYGDWQNQMFDQYGITLSAKELADFDIPGKKAKLEEEMNALIATEPLYAKYGVYTLADYLEFETKYNTDGMSDEESKRYHDDRAVMSRLIATLQSQWWHLDNIEGYYVLFLERNIGMNRNGYSSIITRAEDHYIHTTERNLTRYAIHDTFSSYAMVTGVFAVMAVILITSPLVVTDRRRNITSLHYSSHKGRSMLKLQSAACIFSGWLLGLILVSVSFGLFFLLTDASKYWSAYIGAFDRGIVLYDLWFSQYVSALGGMAVALCTGAAGLTFVLSRYSFNIVTLMLKLIPVGLVIVWIASRSIPSALVTTNNIFNEWFQAKYHVPEVIMCCAVMLLGMAAAVMVATRERRAEV
ncbi:hypothetical protein PA598K_04094 [Paenibacillus sp. 598K]|uniref:hypothetical protein n=1 Tax=Paenibacillus sp. 598K TaxID=1117987 RepID=UPI000FF9697C|nr:hypothetical protein [Paenibacillus sp. 598K]GBF75673.1 hypothetical protein PA598K_04094 [Paenibacillus sp. 598K]